MTLRISAHPLILHKVTLLRDVATEPEKFRQVLAEVSTLLTYEATSDLPLTHRPVTTPLTHMAKSGWCPAKLALAPILRAGLGMVQGACNVIPQAAVWHLGFARSEETLEPRCYLDPGASSELKADRCIVLDPMLATGGTAAAAIALLKTKQIADIRYLCIVAAPEGARRLAQVHPDVTQIIGIVDERLTGDEDDLPNGYIWPGLGDAGDRQFRT